MNRIWNKRIICNTLLNQPELCNEIMENFIHNNLPKIGWMMFEYECNNTIPVAINSKIAHLLISLKFIVSWLFFPFYMKLNFDLYFTTYICWPSEIYYPHNSVMFALLKSRKKKKKKNAYIKFIYEKILSNICLFLSL